MSKQALLAEILRLPPEERIALLARFPYSLYYRFDGTSIDVIACLHTRQSPNRWRSRS